jgi:hypothetical protein
MSETNENDIAAAINLSWVEWHMSPGSEKSNTLRLLLGLPKPSNVRRESSKGIDKALIL